MKNTSDEITFSSSQQDKAKSALLDMTPDHLAQWRNNLALSDIGVAAKKIYLVMHDMHSVQLEPLTRLEMMELLRPTVSFICTHLSKKIFEDSQPVAVKKNKIALLIQTLRLEAAEGYRIVIDQLSSNRMHKKMLLMAIYRLMTFQYKILSTSYQLYASPPEGLWLEIHRLYSFSEKQHLATKLITEDNLVQIRHKTILDAYKHCLLMEASNPFRLSQKEIQQLDYLLEEWIKHVNLKPIENTPHEFIIVNLDKDTGPTYQEGTHSSPQTGKILSLDLDKLVKYISKIIEIKESKSPEKNDTQLSALEQMINSILLEKLYTSWTQRPTRSNDRVATHGKIKVSIGLSSIHYFLNKMIQPNPVGETPPSQDEIIMSSKTEEISNIPVNNYYCQIVNESPTGLRLEWEENPPHEINALELIGLEMRNEEKHSFWLIGSIQWLKQVNGKLNIGVKILSPFAKPVKIQLYNSHDGAVSKLMCALLIPELPHLMQRQSIITPYLPFKENSKIALLVDSEEIHGELKSTLFKADHYKQFTIEYDTKTPHLDLGPFKVGEHDPKPISTSMNKS
ncbi:MAG: hypothetical protein U1E78_00665 [Gammaproteobacteria bacterium]